MKKVYKLLLLIILCFSFIGSVQAKDPIYTAVYRNKYTKSDDQPNVMFSVYQRAANHNMLYASPMNKFTYQNETKSSDDAWISGGGKNEIKLVIGEDALKIDFDLNAYENKKYLYYDIVKDGVFGGKNKLYLSDNPLDKNKITYDMMFEKTPKYADSKPNAILQEMLCTYGPSANQKMESHYKFISIGMIREKNSNNPKYQVYLDFNPVFDEYKEVSIDYKGQSFDEKFDVELGDYLLTLYFKDHFSPRNLWDQDTGVLGCPSGIMMGYKSTSATYVGSGSSLPGATTSGSETAQMEIGWKEVMDKDYQNDTKNFAFSIETSHQYDLVLYENSSYVEYTQGEKNTQTCMYSTEVCDPTKDDCDDHWEVALKEVYYPDGRTQFDFYNKEGSLHSSFDSIYFDYKFYPGLIMDTCDNVPVIYTNCFNGDTSHQYYKGYGAGAAYVKVPTNQCIVAREEFPGSEKFMSNKYLDEFDRQTVEESMGESNGLRFRQYMCQVKPMLNALANSYDPSKITELKKTTKLDFYSKTSKEKVSYNITEVPCSTWGIEEKFECDSECMKDLDYEANKKLREVFYYCNDVKKEYLTFEVNEEFNNGRYQECKKFDEFYDSLVANGILTDIFIGCDFITAGLRNKLEFILDLIKIFGPVMAIVLGMLDFGKVVITGDPDKEMKSAGKRFITRLIAAGLLFLIPALISIPLNVVFQDKVESSPLCDLDKRSS